MMHYLTTSVITERQRTGTNMDEDDKDALAELLFAAENYDSNPMFLTLGNLRDVCHRCMRKVNNYPNNLLREPLLQNIPRLFLGYEKLRWTTTYELRKSTLQLLAKPDNLDYLSRVADGDDALAWFCCDEAMVYNFNDDKLIDPTFLAILRHWTGQPIADSLHPSLDKVIPLIYGEGYWALYGCANPGTGGINILQSVIRDIRTMNPPLAFRGQEVSLEITDLPSTML